VLSHPRSLRLPGLHHLLVYRPAGCITSRRRGLPPWPPCLQAEAAQLEKQGSNVSQLPAAPDAKPRQLVLLEGQCASLQLRLDNVGAHAVDHASVDVQASNNVLAKYARDRHPLVHFTGAL
jgi:hypothetical protein